VCLIAVALSACDVRVGEQGVSVEMVEGMAREEWMRTYSIAPGGRLEIINTNGVIEVFPATGADVEVRARSEVKSRTDERAKQLLEQLTIAEEVAPDRVRIETKMAADSGGFGQRVSVAYRVSLPPGLAVSLRTESGGARFENVDGQFTIASTNGMITGRGVSGSLDASTVNGGINIELTAIRDDVRMTTVNGGIRVDVGPAVNATLDASAVNGGVVIREGVSFEATERERRRVAGAINKGGPRLALHTTNGGIVVGAGPGRGETRQIEQRLQAR
jgi:DUF4097 and DUF4098 domain-containing protein YvlB